MKKVKLLSLSLLLSLVITSCSQQPTCSDDTSKTTAKELVEEILCYKLAYSYFIKDYRYYPFIKNYDAVESEIKKEVHSQSDKKSIYTPFIEKAKSKIEELKPEIINIRTTDINKELKKCDCEGTINLDNGNTVDMIYTVQIDDEGETYVEVMMDDL